MTTALECATQAIETARRLLDERVGGVPRMDDLGRAGWAMSLDLDLDLDLDLGRMDPSSR